MTEIKIYSDEDVNIAITDGLKNRGIKAYSCQEVGNIGLTDEEQINYANSNKSVIKLSVGNIIRKIEFLVSILSEEDMENHVEFL